ncbi:serine/threonine kinase [Aureococcus anophagefferens]|nr:serine/threonine kinase [Aureococcus anophagefferens]
MKSTSSSCGTLEGLAAAEEVVTVPEDDDLLEELRLSSEQVGARRSGAEACLDDFDVLSQIGEGGFGKVVLAKKRDGGSLHAIKAVRKERLLHAGEAAVQHMLDENHILQTMRHPFILTLQYAFQDATRLYLVTNFVGGGNLYQLITRLGVLGEPLARFYAAQLVSAFSYLHGQGIVYRDLKPENVLLGLDGYVAETFCGTPLYLAPEVVAKMPYGRSVDWWTLGCLLVEMLTGRPPFLATNLPDLMELIRTGTPSFLTSAKLGAAAKDCCAKLLERKPEDRLGCGEGLGVKALEAHAFFADVPWRSLEAKRETPPFLPDPATDVMGRVHALSEQTETVAKPLFDDFRAFLLSEGADVAARDRWGGTPLGDAAREGHDAVCALLRAEGARDDDVPDDTGASSGRGGRRRALVALLDAGAAPGAADARAAARSTRRRRAASRTRWACCSRGRAARGRGRRGRTPVHAAAAGHGDVVGKLLHFGARANARDRFGGTPLKAALAAGHADIAAAARGRRRRGPEDAGVANVGKLLEAAKRGDRDALRRLLDAAVDVNGADYDRRTALHLAAAEGELDAVRFLVDRGADVNAVDRWRGTPLRDAEDGRHASVVALLEAAKRGDVGGIRALLASGVDVNGGDYDKRTALHLAAAEGHADAVRFLIDEKAAIDVVDRWRGTPLRDAEDGNHLSVVALLRKHGAAETGRRPRASSAADAVGALCEAARHGDTATLRELIDGGADVTAGDYDKRTALHLAAAEGHVDAVRFLVDRGANVDAVDRWHGTPLRDAEQGHHAAVVKLLRERGAATPPSATPRRRSRSWGSLVAMPSPRRIGKALTKKHSMPVLPYDDSNDPPEPESPGLVINPPRKADDEHQKAELDRSNGSCAIA